MTYKEFIEHCYCCGGNWIDMLLTGCRELWPEDTKVFEEKDEAFKTDDGFVQYAAIVKFLRNHGVEVNG